MNPSGEPLLASASPAASATPWPWRRMLVITLVALALYVAVRNLPTGTNLSHMDFRAGASAVDFCDPANPQFIPVAAVRSPVEMNLAPSAPVTAGAEALVTATLKTSTGKPVAPEDLLVVHTRKLHLLLIDPTLTDYQHVHPFPGKTPGEWNFTFTPRRGGRYRVFADFTPTATARGLYAGADLEVAVSVGNADVTVPATPPVVGGSLTHEADGFRFELRLASGAVRAGQQADLSFTVTRADGGDVPLQPVMDAYAHLVAFDAERSGYAHLHPNETDLARAPDGRRPTLTFKITIPRPGRYVVWAQVNLGGREVFAPFRLEVVP